MRLTQVDGLKSRPWKVPGVVRYLLSGVVDAHEAGLRHSTAKRIQKIAGSAPNVHYGAGRERRNPIADQPTAMHGRRIKSIGICPELPADVIIDSSVVIPRRLDNWLVHIALNSNW
jgi:hypothetical protein